MLLGVVLLFQEQLISYVEDRAFNDLRYTVNSEALQTLGWKEEVSSSHSASKHLPTGTDRTLGRRAPTSRVRDASPCLCLG